VHSWTRDREKFWSRANGCGEEAQLSSGWISVGSELSSLNFKYLVRAKQSFANRYSNIVIKSLCVNLDICLNYYANACFRSRNPVRVLSVVGAFFKSCFLVALLKGLLGFATEIHFDREKTKHANSPIDSKRIPHYYRGGTLVTQY